MLIILSGLVKLSLKICKSSSDTKLSWPLENFKAHSDKTCWIVIGDGTAISSKNVKLHFSLSLSIPPPPRIIHFHEIIKVSGAILFCFVLFHLLWKRKQREFIGSLSYVENVWKRHTYFHFKRHSSKHYE